MYRRTALQEEDDEATLPQYYPDTSQSPPKYVHSDTPAVTVISHQRSCPGALSLHEYRKQLSRPDLPVLDASGGRKVRRKSGAANLNRSHSQHPLSGWYRYPGDSVSSAASSPPPLSPSLSFSVMSQSQGSDGDVSGIYSERLRNGKNTGTTHGQAGDLPLEAIHRGRKLNKTCSDSVLGQKQHTTVFHEGASFQILNPRDSLRFARVVSYIEDMDYSQDESGRDPWLGATDGIAEEDESIYSEPHRLSNSREEYLEDGQIKPAEEEQQAHVDIMGNPPYAPSPSTSERLVDGPRHGSPPGYYGSESTLHEAEPPEYPNLQPIEESEVEQPVSSLYETDVSNPAFFNHRPSLGSYPFTQISAGHMENINSFYFQNQHSGIPPSLVVRTGSRKLRKARPVPAVTQEEKGTMKNSIFRPFRRLRDAVKAFS